MNRIHLLIILVGSWIHLLIIVGYHPTIPWFSHRGLETGGPNARYLGRSGSPAARSQRERKSDDTWWNHQSFWWKMGILSGDFSGDLIGETSPILVKTHTRCGVNMNIPAEVMWTTGASKLLTTHLESWTIQHGGYTPGILLGWWSFRGYPSL